MLCCLLYGISQNNAFLEGSVGEHLLTKPKSLVFSPDGSKDIIGSPYVKDSFEPGNIYTMKGILRDIEMRYDLYNDWIEYRQKDQIYILDPTPKILKVEWKDLIVINALYETQGKFKMGFFSLLDSAKVLLFSKHTVIFEKGEPPKPYVLAGTPARFTRSKDVFYYKPEKSVAKPITSVKKMIELFPDHREELLTFIEKNKINTKLADLKELWKYYKTL